MYRILRQHGEIRERRAQATHPAKVKPELVATAPGHVYSWDITKLPGPGRREYSEAQFKTLKYSPAFPGRFGSLTDARAFCQTFFNHYNGIHRHKAIGLHTPASVHYGTATEIRANRAVVLDAAHARNPERFSKPPTPPRLPTAAWINPPTPAPQIQTV
jgi:hypothetical protein